MARVVRGPDGSIRNAMELTALDGLIRSTISEFTAAIFDSGWRGREREAVSLYAAGFLQPRCLPGALLRDPTQVAIEVAVPGVLSLNPKGRVNKDLVIWPEPRMTLWDKNWAAVNEPLAVLEWKVFRLATRPPRVSDHDVEWLTAFSGSRDRFVGYAVTIDLAGRSFRTRVARFSRGNIEAEWLVL